MRRPPPLFATFGLGHIFYLRQLRALLDYFLFAHTHTMAKTLAEQLADARLRNAARRAASKPPPGWPKSEWKEHQRGLLWAGRKDARTAAVQKRRAQRKTATATRRAIVKRVTGEMRAQRAAANREWEADYRRKFRDPLDAGAAKIKIWNTVLRSNHQLYSRAENGERASFPSRFANAAVYESIKLKYKQALADAGLAKPYPRGYTPTVGVGRIRQRLANALEDGRFEDRNLSVTQASRDKASFLARSRAERRHQRAILRKQLADGVRVQREKKAKPQPKPASKPKAAKKARKAKAPAAIPVALLRRSSRLKK